MVFAERVDAGRELATRLELLRREPVVVLGHSRGGGPTAYEVATALGGPLEVIVVDKIGVSGGQVYVDVSQTSDEAVRTCRLRASERAAAMAGPGSLQTAAEAPRGCSTRLLAPAPPPAR